MSSAQGAVACECVGARIATLECLESRRLLDGSASSGTSGVSAGVYSLNLKQLEILETNTATTNQLIKFGSADPIHIYPDLSGPFALFDDLIAARGTAAPADTPARVISGTAKSDVIVVNIDADNTFAVSVNGNKGTGNAGAVVITANAGDDFVVVSRHPDSTARVTIYGAAGNDSIVGSAGAERIFAGDGNDFVLAGNGNDTVYGEAGDDSLRGGNHADLLDGGGGNDIVRGDAGNDNLSGGDGFDRLRGSDGDDKLFGGASKDFLGGEAGEDDLRGDGGNDVLAGGEGDDLLAGGAGDDLLEGEAGGDLLFGENGGDILHGGAGDDGFPDHSPLQDGQCDIAAEDTADTDAMTTSGIHRILQFDMPTSRVILRPGTEVTNRTIWLLNENYVVFGSPGATSP